MSLVRQLVSVPNSLRNSHSSSTAIFPYLCLICSFLSMTFDLALSSGFRSYWFLFLVNLARLVQSVSGKTLGSFVNLMLK